MAIPTGTGTEVLKSLNYVGVNDATWRDILGSSSGTTALHIYTVLSIIITDQTVSSKKVKFRTVDADGSSNSTIFMAGTTVGADGTFVWNDKFVVTGGTRLQVIGDSSSGSNFNVWCSYIDQDWT
jgi:hypothetical protein